MQVNFISLILPYPLLLRSLDEQKSPKSKLAVLEFANASFVKCTINSDSFSSSSFLKPWFGKLALLFKDKSKKLKEAALVGFSSIYSHYDPASMLSFLVNLSMEEQKRLRRAMKQLIPTIESDLEEFLQQRRHKQKASSFDIFTAKSPLHPASQSAKSPMHPAYRSAKSPLHPTYQYAKSPLHPTYQSAKSPMHPAHPSNSVKTDDCFSSALQCLPNMSLEVQERRTERIEFESSSEYYGDKAEMMDKKSSTMKPRNGLQRRIDFSMISDNTMQNASRDGQNMKVFDKPNASELSMNIRNDEITGDDCQDHKVSIFQLASLSIYNIINSNNMTNLLMFCWKNTFAFFSSLQQLATDFIFYLQEVVRQLEEVLETNRHRVPTKVRLDCTFLVLYGVSP